MVKNRKKYESDIVELEGALEVASRSTGDFQKNIKKLQTQVKVQSYFSWLFYCYIYEEYLHWLLNLIHQMSLSLWQLK